MFLSSIIFFYLIFISLSRGPIYLCGDDSYADEQCLHKETLGDNEFIWVRKCKGAKVCLTLPYYDKTIGACNIKVRTHYDGESCLSDNKCTTRICDGTKCKGYKEGRACIPGLAQCEQGLVCGYSTSSSSETATCMQPIGEGGACYVYSNEDMSIRDDEYSLYGSGYAFFVPWYNPCGLNLVCNSGSLPGSTTRKNGTCQNIRSINNGGKASNPLLCESGTFSDTNGTCGNVNKDGSCNPFTSELNNNYEVVTSGDIGCVTTSKGGSMYMNETVSEEFRIWVEESKNHKKKEEKSILEAYRYTRNNKGINENYFRYTHYGWIGDADKCAYDYMWKNTQGSEIKVKFGILFFFLMIIF